MQLSITTEHVNAVPLAVVRRRAPKNQLSKVVPEACGVVWNAIKAAGVKGGKMVAVYLDQSDGQVTLEIGAEVPIAFAGHGNVVSSSLPGGEVATATHFGPYGTLGQTHEAIQRWCSGKGLKLAGPCWELYDHWKEEWVTNPAKIRTDVFYLLADA